MSNGETLRDLGLQAVAQSNSAWFKAALAEVYQLSPGWMGIGEDLKPIIIPVLGEPNKPQCWGSVVMHAVRLGYLTPTGVHTKMKKSSSHARKSEIHVRTGVPVP